VSAAEAAFGGGVFIADKSAWARADRTSVREEWSQALLSGQIVTCDINRLELLYSARTAQEFAQMEEEFAALRNIATTHGIYEAAIEALRTLATVSDGHHRVKPPDALLAASAQEAGIGVLHYDHDFDRLVEVMSFESRWIAPAGVLD
jgi:predicted nucleic acid-binding protein